MVAYRLAVFEVPQSYPRGAVVVMPSGVHEYWSFQFPGTLQLSYFKSVGVKKTGQLAGVLEVMSTGLTINTPFIEGSSVNLFVAERSRVSFACGRTYRHSD
jgi:hypothetical protein